MSISLRFKANEIFFSYAPQDKKLFKLLMNHLALLKSEYSTSRALLSKEVSTYTAQFSLSEGDDKNEKHLFTAFQRWLGDRLLPAHEGRCLHWWKGRWSCVSVLLNTFVKQRRARQVLAQKGGQVFVGGFYAIQKTAALIDSHCLLVLKLRVKPFRDNGSQEKVGDRARTGDSLLGRQVVPISPLASPKMASQAVLALPPSM